MEINPLVVLSIIAGVVVVIGAFLLDVHDNCNREEERKLQE